MNKLVVLSHIDSSYLLLIGGERFDICTLSYGYDTDADLRLSVHLRIALTETQSFYV
jgi:hypothetical protein